MFMLMRSAAFRNSGSLAIAARAPSHFLTIESGVPAGNASAAHHCTRTPFITPCSSAVGTAGSAAMRVGERTARSRILPACSMALASATEWIASITWPPANFVMESEAPGVMTIFVFSGSTPIWLNQSYAV